MTAQASLAHDLHTELVAIYEEVMWLSRRPNVTASCARAWYTHIMSERVKRRIRRFTGKVSRSAAENDAATLCLEHFRRIQTTLTSLIERHRESKTSNSEEFVRVLVECERVHIVTVEENYAAMCAEGSYSKAGNRAGSLARTVPEAASHVVEEDASRKDRERGSLCTKTQRPSLTLRSSGPLSEAAENYRLVCGCSNRWSTRPQAKKTPEA
jgi:hypothetical protein